MVFALNAFNLVEGAEDLYKRYAVSAGRLLQGVGGSVAAAGRRPRRVLAGDVVRHYFMIVQFPDEHAFSKFLAAMEDAEIHQTRHAITRDYIWTLYEPWDLTRWVNE